MAAPGVSVTVRDGGLGIVPPGAGNVFAKIGPSPIGVVNSVNSVSDNTTLQKACGNGGLMVEAAALALAVGGQGPSKPAGLLLVPVNPTTYGTATAVTHTGPGTGTVTVSLKPAFAFQLKCITGGTTTTATYQVSLDGGITYGATFTSAATVVIPGVSFTTLAFGAGSAVSGDITTIATSGTITQTSGSGTLAITLSAACPVDAYTVIVTITAAGGLGVGFFTYSLDGGVTTSGQNLIPSSGAAVVTDGSDPLKAGQCSTGILATFSGTFTAGDTYSWNTTTASYTTTDLTNAFNALYVDARYSSGIGLHVVGPASSVANAATLLASLDTLMGTAVGSFKFDRAMIEVPQDTDANILAAFAASSSKLVGAAAGFHKVVSPINGRVQSRPNAYSVMARAGAVPAQNDLGRVFDGSLPGVVSLVRDEFQTPGLDAGRFTTLTTIPGRNGFWVTNGRLMSQAGSDFTFWQYGRVMDLASFYTRLALLNFLNDSVRVNGDGTISEKDARRIEQFTDQFVRNAMPPGSFSDFIIQLSRVNNVLSTQTILPTARVIPLGYAKFIALDIGFTNQALVVKAA